MSNRKLRGLFSGMLMFLLLATVASAQWVGVEVTEAQMDDVVIEPYGSTQLSVERGQEVELELHLESHREAKDVEIQAFITGYEHNNIEQIKSMIGPYDFYENTTYVKKMNLALPDDLEEDEYWLRVFISDRDSEETNLYYVLKLDVPRHELQIEDVILSPSGTVDAGSALLASVRVQNRGEKDEENVKVTVSLPELNVKASEYIEEIESGDDEVETEELYLRLPRCADPGEYAMRIDVLYNNDHEQTSALTKITVAENEACNPEPVVVVQPEEAAVETVEEEAPVQKSNLRTALEVILIVLIALLVLVGLVIGFSRMRSDE